MVTRTRAVCVAVATLVACLIPAGAAVPVMPRPHFTPEVRLDTSQVAEGPTCTLDLTADVADPIDLPCTP